MLKNISPILSPELLKTLMEMGHGDTIVLADGNFPAAALGQRLVRCDGHPITPLLDAVLELFPLDVYTDTPVTLMETVPGETYKPVIWEEYRKTFEKHAPDFKDFHHTDRFDFYEQAKDAFAVVATGEKALYANILLTKGVVTD